MNDKGLYEVSDTEAIQTGLEPIFYNKHSAGPRCIDQVDKICKIACIKCKSSRVGNCCQNVTNNVIILQVTWRTGSQTRN